MVNLPKSRKVTEKKNLIKLTNKGSKKIELQTNLEDVLLVFLQIFSGDRPVWEKQNHEISIAIRQLLSSLKSLLGKRSNDLPLEITAVQHEKVTELVVKCGNILNSIYSSQSIFPETITLSALCVAFLFLNYYKFCNKNWSTSEEIENTVNQASTLSLISLLKRTKPFDEEYLQLCCRFANEREELETMPEEVFEERLNQSCLSFRDAALLCGLLNCTPMVSTLIDSLHRVFIKMFDLIERLCSLRLQNEFHVFRLLNLYWKLFLENRNAIEAKYAGNIGDLHGVLSRMFEKTLFIIDHNWESPITGVGNCMKQTYQWVVQFMRHCNLLSFVLSEFKRSLSLPFSSKAKFKKLTILTQTLSNHSIDSSQVFLHFNTQLDEMEIELTQLPFYIDSTFANQVIKNLSINSLSTSIAEYYKASVNSIVQFGKDSGRITNTWCRIWLDAIVGIFLTDSTMASCTVVQNTLLAHILPHTIQHIPNSVSILLNAYSGCLYGQVSVVRIYLERFSNSSQVEAKELPPRRWLGSVLTHRDEMTRAEGLSLLLDEKFIHKDRLLVCRLVMLFLQTNLNVDNAAFRQKIMSKLEQFYFKIINSICDRYECDSELKHLDETSFAVIKFLADTLDLLTLSLCPGSCFQRKFTSLNILGSILEIMAKEDTKGTLCNLFSQYSKENSLLIPRKRLLFYGLIDKDDKIRRLSCEIMIQYAQSSLALVPNQNDGIESDIIQRVAMHFLKSFRHQECHIGGLLQKYLLRVEVSSLSSFATTSSPGLSLISNLVESVATLFYSDQFRSNLLISAHQDPLHGWILTLNHCLTFDSFYEGILQSSNDESPNYPILFDSKLRQMFQRLVQLSLDCLKYFLGLLNPKNGDVDQSFALEDEDDFASPSFYEMCQSIMQIICIEELPSADTGDIFLSNNFQLILSMCWLNIKENCFLLTTLTSLFADLLCLLCEHPEAVPSERSEDVFLLSPDELCQIGTRIAMLMLRCRHKGVIEASGVSLTKYTRTLLRVQSYLARSSLFGSSIQQNYRNALQRYISEILSIVDLERQSVSTSVTRRSAGLALVIQSVLVGEAEAINLDGIRTMDDASNNTLYEQIISVLTSIAKSPVLQKDLSQDDLQTVDLPQANALHVLQSIIGTSAMSHLSYKTVEHLFPICVAGFTSSHWQIRNASLQLFGACTTRMLGQKKRVKSDSNENLLAGSTITFDEFMARYPTLVPIISDQLNTALTKPDSLHPELVPVLALLASFTAQGCEPREHHSTDRLVEALKKCLENRIWKVRQLAAKSLVNLYSWSDMENFITDSASRGNLSANHLHGLLSCVHALIESKASVDSNLHEYRMRFYRTFKAHLKEPSCKVMEPFVKTIFEQTLIEYVEFEEENQESLSLQSSWKDLDQIKFNISFRQPDDVRLAAAEALCALVGRFVEKNHSSPTECLSEGQLIEFTHIVLTLLEDEERMVRAQAQSAITLLYKSIQPSESFIESLAPNVAFDCFLEWLSTQSHFQATMIHLFLTRVANFKSFLQNNMNEDELVLFEKEEKNVFAEPYLVNIRIANYLIANLDDSWFVPDCKDIIADLHLVNSQILSGIAQNSHLDQYFMTRSIWKLPKLFCLLVNLHLTLQVLKLWRVDLTSLSTQQRVFQQFGFIPKLQSYFDFPGLSLLSCDYK